MKNTATGLHRILRAAGFSWSGLVTAAREETAFRQELYLAAGLIPLALWLGNSGLERAVMIGSILIVLIAELLNTGIEAVVDRIGDEYHELSGRAKDVGSAAVLLAILNAGIVWLLILLG